MIVRIALLVTLALLVSLVMASVAWSKRRLSETGSARRTAVAMAGYIPGSAQSSLPPLRTVAQIAADNPAPKSLEEWLTENESLILLDEINELTAGMAKMESDILASAEQSAEALARFMGYRGGVTEIRATELIAAAHGNQAEVFDAVTEAAPCDMDFELEAAAMLDAEAEAGIVAEVVAQLTMVSQ
jgi:hypothetical protein